MLHLRGNELQATALTVLLLLQQVPHLGVILGHTVLTCPCTFFIHSTGGGVGLLPTHTEANRGSPAQWLLTEKDTVYTVERFKAKGSLQESYKNTFTFNTFNTIIQLP